jgi:ABC-type polysaccharide/polyol phosphate export permease
MAGFIESYRAVLLLGQPPPIYLLGPAILVSVGIFIVGLWLFKKLEGNLVDLL